MPHTRIRHTWSLSLLLVLGACSSVTPSSPFLPTLEEGSSASTLAFETETETETEARVRRTPSEQKATLERALDGLLYLSESERPWTYTLLEGATFTDFEALQAGKVLEQRRTFTDFFSQLSQIPTGNPVGTRTAKRYFRLGNLLERRFSSLKVYWVTDPVNPVEVQLVIVGINRFGAAMLETVSIET